MPDDQRDALLLDVAAAARFARLERDFDAVMAARGPAFGASRALLSLLLSASTTRAELLAAARTAHLATGDLWDALSRVQDP